MGHLTLNNAKHAFSPTSQLTKTSIAGYGLADFGMMAVLQFAIIYLLYFYTEFVGVSAAFAGTLFLLSRIWDAINDPLMGLIVDNTSTRYGKCRPYLIGGSLLFGLTSLSIFWVPSLSGWQLSIYVIVTYNLFNMSFTSMSIPFTALLTLMTPNKQQRVTLSSSRAFFEALAFASVPVIAEWLINQTGGRDSATAYLSTTAIFSLLMLITSCIAFLTSREQIHSDTNSVRIKDIFLVIDKNWPWLIVMAINALVNISITMRTSSAIYYFEYIVQDMRYFGLFMTLGFVALFPFAFIAPIISKRYGKRTVTLIGCILAIIGHCLVILFPVSIPILLIGSFLSGCAMGGMVSVLFAMIGDIADDVSHRKNFRAEGVVTSAVSLGYKLGLGLGAALVGWLLSWGQYVPSANMQTDSALTAISAAFVWVPILILLICIPVVYQYKLDRSGSNC